MVEPRTPDSGAKGRGFDTDLRRVVSLSKNTFTPPKVLIIPRKRWLRPDMTEKNVYWDVKPQQNQNKTVPKFSWKD